MTTRIVAAPYLHQAVEVGAHRKITIHHGVAAHQGVAARRQVAHNSHVAAPHPPTSEDDKMPDALRNEGAGASAGGTEDRRPSLVMRRTTRAPTAPSQAIRATGHLPVLTLRCALIWQACSWKQRAAGELAGLSISRGWLTGPTRRGRKTQRTLKAKGRRRGEMTPPIRPPRRVPNIKIHNPVTREAKRATTLEAERALLPQPNDASHSTSYLQKS